MTHCYLFFLRWVSGATPSFLNGSQAPFCGYFSLTWGSVMPWHPWVSLGQTCCLELGWVASVQSWLGN